MEYYFERYGDLALHRRMLSDRRRTDAFAHAIREVVRAKDVVIDVGTGTGILAMLSAQAGAQRVYAIDQAQITQSAANLVKINNLQKTVKVLNGLAKDLELNEKADVIVSEWLGNFAFVEAMLNDVLSVRDRYLKTRGRMIPHAVSLYLAPVDDPMTYFADNAGWWRRPIHGLDFSSLEETELRQGMATQLRIEPSTLLAEGIPIARVDIQTATEESPFQSGTVEFEAMRDGVLNGFAGWFVAHLSKTVDLDTGPFVPETHWAQTYLPFPPRIVKKGAHIVADFSVERDINERRYLMLELKLGKKAHRYRLE